MPLIAVDVWFNSLDKLSYTFVVPEEIDLPQQQAIYVLEKMKEIVVLNPQINDLVKEEELN